MAKPHLLSIAASVYSRLSDDLVSTYAKGVYTTRAREDLLPELDDKPLVIASYAFQRNPTFENDDGTISLDVYVVVHVEAAFATAATCIERIVGDGSTYGLQRWTPTVSGLGTNPLEETGQQGAIQIDEHRIAYALEFETYVAEG